MNRIAVIGIIVEEPQEVEKLNQLLHEYGSYIIGRMGIPYRERKIHVISISMDAPQDTIKETCMNRDILSKIEQEQMISREELEELLTTTDQELIEELYRRARATAGKYYGKEIYLRGLIEFTNYCKNNCYYCGIRCGNEKAQRYRLTMDQILSCCESGWELGFRTFVLQGGEDPYYTDERICTIIKEIKKRYPDCAVTLSIGEKERASYQAYFDAGADRYLLRHETADEVHYQKLHPSQMSLAHRKQCLRELKEIGYQTGCGFMVGSPGQTLDTLYEDLMFIKELQPEMVGIWKIPYGFWQSSG